MLPSEEREEIFLTPLILDNTDSNGDVRYASTASGETLFHDAVTDNLGYSVWGKSSIGILKKETTPTINTEKNNIKAVTGRIKNV